jgi:hypothetical protein
MKNLLKTLIKFVAFPALILILSSIAFDRVNSPPILASHSNISSFEIITVQPSSTQEPLNADLTPSYQIETLEQVDPPKYPNPLLNYSLSDWKNLDLDAYGKLDLRTADS